MGNIQHRRHSTTAYFPLVRLTYSPAYMSWELCPSSHGWSARGRRLLFVGPLLLAFEIVLLAFDSLLTCRRLRLGLWRTSWTSWLARWSSIVSVNTGSNGISSLTGWRGCNMLGAVRFKCSDCSDGVLMLVVWLACYNDSTKPKIWIWKVTSCQPGLSEYTQEVERLYNSQVRDSWQLNSAIRARFDSQLSGQGGQKWKKRRNSITPLPKRKQRKLQRPSNPTLLNRKSALVPSVITRTFPPDNAASSLTPLAKYINSFDTLQMWLITITRRRELWSHQFVHIRLMSQTTSCSRVQSCTSSFYNLPNAQQKIQANVFTERDRHMTASTFPTANTFPTASEKLVLLRLWIVPSVNPKIPFSQTLDYAWRKWTSHSSAQEPQRQAEIQFFLRRLSLLNKKLQAHLLFITPSPNSQNCIDCVTCTRACTATSRSQSSPFIRSGDLEKSS